MFENMQPLQNVIDKNDKTYDYEKIKRAFLYAQELHEGQFRLSGEPYISHPKGKICVSFYFHLILVYYSSFFPCAHPDFPVIQQRYA